MRHSTFNRHHLSGLKTFTVSLSAQNLCPLGLSTPAPLGTCHFLHINSSWLKSAETDLFCSFPGACEQWRHYSLWNKQSWCAAIALRGSAQLVASATSAGSRRPLLFQDQWACPRQGFQMGIGACHEYLAWAAPPTPTLPLLPPLPYFQLCGARCQGQRIDMHERTNTIFEEHLSNVNGKGRPCGEYSGSWACVTRFCFVVHMRANAEGSCGV